MDEYHEESLRKQYRRIDFSICDKTGKWYWYYEYICIYVHNHGGAIGY